jgi:ABC-2 type transport system permease protein
MAKVIVGFIVLGIFFTGTFVLFHRLFSYLVTVQDIGVLLIDKLVGIGFLAFFLMLVISNLITSISSLYNSKETAFLMASPLEYREVFWVKFIDTLFYSSWATLVITVPAFIAYSMVHNLPFWDYLIFAGLVIPPFLLITSALGAAFSLIFFPLAYRFGTRKIMILLAIIGVAALFMMMRARFSRILFSAQGDLALLNYYLRELARNDTPILPNVWIVEILQSARTGKFSNMWFYISMLVSTAGAAMVALDILAEKLYYSAYRAAGELLGRRRKVSKRKDFYSTSWKFFSVFPKDMRSLFVKDIRLFLRDPGQWTQFTILLVLVVFYLINLRKVPLNVEGLYWRTLISFVNYAFCGYILATLSVRFVYPSFSMEGQSFWSIASSPVKLRKVFWEKFWIAFIIFFVIAEVVAVVSNSILSQSLAMTLLTGGGIFLMSISLTAISTGLGSIYPSFEEPNPGKIASSGGGMICALVSLVYVALSTLALAIPTHNYLSFLIGQRASFPTAEVAIGFASLIVINIAATYIPLKLGLRAVDKLEF